MYPELDRYIGRLDGLIKQLKPAARKQLSRQIATRLRQSNKQRIRANTAPDGGAFTPRAGRPLRALKKNEKIGVGTKFYYFGAERQMRTVKTAATAAAPSRRTTKPHDDEYVWGYDFEAGGIRKFKKSRIRMPALRHKPMFSRLHQYRWLKQRANSNGAAVGFMGGLVSYIAASHQYGEGNRPERKLLGFSPGDLQMIEEAVVAHFAGAEK